MASNKKDAPNIDNSDLTNYPDGRIRDNSGAGDGTPVNRLIYSDLHEFFAKIMRLAGLVYNGLPDNESNGYQLVEAAVALAGKNDIITTLNVSGGIAQIPVKLSILKDGEILTCVAGFNYATETQIKGTEPSLKTIVVPSGFKTGDYLILINSAANIKIVRLADASNINTLVAELLFLKAATEGEEYAGAITTKATTPYYNQLAFARRVIGLDSGSFLATTIRNGLLSKEDKVLLNSLAVSSVRNTGWFSGVNPGPEPVGTVAPRSGDVVSAVVIMSTTTSITYLVTLANPMVGTNYFVRSSIQSEGIIESDNDVQSAVFRPISPTTFQWSMTEDPVSTQSLKIHIEAVQIS